MAALVMALCGGKAAWRQGGVAKKSGGMLAKYRKIEK